MIKNKGIKIYILIVILFLIFTGFFTNYLYNRNDIIKINRFTLNNKPDNMHSRVLDGNKTKIFEFQTILYKDQFEKLNDDLYKIILNGISGHWYKVYFNDTLLGSFGDTNRGYSNIWSATTFFDLTSDLIKEKNK